MQDPETPGPKGSGFDVIEWSLIVAFAAILLAVFWPTIRDTLAHLVK